MSHLMLMAGMVVVSAGAGYGFRGWIRKKLGYVEMKVQAAAQAAAKKV